MQDNNWKDDAAFWDEAWADMTERLDKRSSGSPLPWWLVPILLLLVGGGLYIYLSDEAPGAGKENLALTQVQGTDDNAATAATPNAAQ